MRDTRNRWKTFTMYMEYDGRSAGINPHARVKINEKNMEDVEIGSLLSSFVFSISTISQRF
jgi:hypothetical protein